jgi:hypothetical protein
MGASLSQHLHNRLYSETILVNILPDVKTPSEFYFGANMATRILSHQPMAYIFQFRPMFFETPQVIGP